MMIDCIFCNRPCDDFVFDEDGYICFDCWEKVRDQKNPKIITFKGRTIINRNFSGVICNDDKE